DGDLDAFEGNYGGGLGGQERLLLNGGTGVFTDVTATNLPALFDWTQAVALVDVDGDGDLDAFVGNSLSGPGAQDRLHLNDGTGVFTDVTATSLPPLLENTYAVAFGDVDGDGDFDAFVGNVGAPSLNRLYLNGGTGVFTDVTATSLPAVISESTHAVALGDVDADGDLDVLVGNSSGGQNRLYLNAGTGVLTDVTAMNLPPPPTFAAGVAPGDVDGDGDLDVFVGGNGQNRLYVNAGTGVFADVTATNLPAVLCNTQEVALGDVDGDGDLDAFVGCYGGLDRLHLNDGTGVFIDVTATNLPGLLGYAAAVALGDVDGDGDLDAYVGNYDLQDRLYLNGGTGVFANGTATNLPVLVDPTTTVGLGDVDGGGDLDAFVGNWDQVGPGEQDRLYLNGGTGVFIDVTATSLPALLGYTTAVALGDVDGDGDLDAFVGNFDNSGPDDQELLHLNSGTGVFTDVTATNLPVLLDHTTAVALGDVDGDGDLDAFVGNVGQNRLCLNGGTGVFADVTATDLPALANTTSAVALGDVDGDGDLDAFAGGNGPNRSYTNLTRQVAWRGIPRVGKPLVLDLWGPASGFWVLGTSLGNASIPLFPLGTLRLDPATLIVAGGGALDPQGRASLSILVPPSPALVGLSLYWQAGVGPPAFLTNLEITTATDL
ncbi:MAG: VCBS repeat-containing protein, partial [Planctomycetes bacterium]|nr:VCBS repeat-containing protein [Planctomycetota bacterium]